MVEKKKKNPDKVRICVDITTEQHEFVKAYNENTSRPLMLSRVCSLAIEHEIEQIKKEMEKQRQEWIKQEELRSEEKTE